MSGIPALRLSGAETLCDGALQTADITVQNGYFTGGSGVRVDLSGYYILPGIIDLHGDAFERHIAPRPRAPFSIRSGLSAAARDAAAHGVTTAWFAQCWSWEGGLRGPEYCEKLLTEMDRFKKECPIDVRVQIRCETHAVDTREQLIATVRRHDVDYVVFNNHLPEALDVLRDDPDEFAIWARRAFDSPDDFAALLKKLRDRDTEVPRHLMKLAEAFDTLGVIYGSHDDPDAETREKYRLIGAHIAEFPTSEKAASAAKAMEDPVLMGAPNVARGGSQSGNISAQKLIERDLVDALVSDYHYPALMQAAWRLVDEGVLPLSEAWALISSNPARIMHLSDRGAIEAGKRADFVIVNRQTRDVEATFSGGQMAYLSGEVGARFLKAASGMAIAAE